MAEISGVYRIINTVTGDFYIGSSKNVKSRWAVHKCPSYWNKCPNNPMYQDMQKYGVDKFDFQVLEVVEPEELKEREQQFIERLNPTYNDRNANGWDIERYKEYNKTEKRKKYQKEYQKQYQKEYKKSDKCKETQKEYRNQLCFYNGETITLNTLSMRFRRRGIPNPTQEAKKYLLH